MDKMDYALIASLNLSAPFDIVNVRLVMKRLETPGLPPDVLRLIQIWITNRSYYVNINEQKS